LVKALDAQQAATLDLPRQSYDEVAFRFALNQDAMGTEKLSEGIRAFCVDAGKLDQMLLAA
jgi:transaldolase